MNKFVGIDIFKETFDIYFEQEGKGCHVKLQQTEKDYKILLHLVGKDAIFIMEATGNYHLNLAHYLHQVGIKVIAEHPLKITRFSSIPTNLFILSLLI
jgi:transposase